MHCDDLLDVVKRSRHAIGLVTSPCSPGQYRCDRSTSWPVCAFSWFCWLCDRYWAMPAAAAAAIVKRGEMPPPARN